MYYENTGDAVEVIQALADIGAEIFHVNDNGGLTEEQEAAEQARYEVFDPDVLVVDHEPAQEIASFVARVRYLYPAVPLVWLVKEEAININRLDAGLVVLLQRPTTANRVKDAIRICRSSRRDLWLLPPV